MSYIFRPPSFVPYMVRNRIPPRTAPPPPSGTGKNLLLLGVG
jgi:hypothetical protein